MAATAIKQKSQKANGKCHANRAHRLEAMTQCVTCKKGTDPPIRGAAYDSKKRCGTEMLLGAYKNGADCGQVVASAKEATRCVCFDGVLMGGTPKGKEKE